MPSWLVRLQPRALQAQPACHRLLRHPARRRQGRCLPCPPPPTLQGALLGRLLACSGARVDKGMLRRPAQHACPLAPVPDHLYVTGCTIWLAWCVCLSTQRCRPGRNAICGRAQRCGQRQGCTASLQFKRRRLGATGRPLVRAGHRGRPVVYLYVHLFHHVARLLYHRKGGLHGPRSLVERSQS